MRPIATVSAEAAYSKEEELQRLVTARAMEAPANTQDDDDDDSDDNDDNGAPAKRRQTAHSAPVETLLNDLEDLLVTYWDPQQRWQPDAVRHRARLRREDVGDGYEHATRDLIEQTGPYCAYCDAPLFSGLLAEPIPPLRWFPTVAFDYDKLLLTCPSCYAAKGDKPQRGLDDPTNAAWPHLFWQDLADGALLPFRYDLLRVNWSGFGVTPVGPLENIDDKTLVQFYRLGYIHVQHTQFNRRGAVVLELPDSEPIPVAAWLSPTDTDREVEGKVAHLIEFMNLNGVESRQQHARLDSQLALQQHEDQDHRLSLRQKHAGLDRRLALRTMAFFTALDFRERLDTIHTMGDGLLEMAQALCWRAIQATGFWGVWLSVFNDVPNFQARLVETLPGTAARSWVL